MVERLTGKQNESTSQEKLVGIRSVESLLLNAHGFQASLREKTLGHDRLLIPDTVSFYLPRHCLDIENNFEQLKPTDIGLVEDTVLDELAGRTLLMCIFEKETQKVPLLLKDSARVTFSVRPDIPAIAPIDQGIRGFYDTLSPVLDQLKDQPGHFINFPRGQENKLAADVISLIQDPATMIEIRDLHMSMQGSFGVASAIENRQGQKPEVLNKLQKIQQDIDFTNPSHKAGFQKLAFYYLVAEPYFNRGAGQGYPR